MAAVRVLVMLCLTELALGVDCARGDVPEGHPRLARYYTFEEVTVEGAVAASEAGDREPATYVGDDPLVVVEGRRPGTQAVRLDHGCFQAKPAALGGSSLTVEIWFRKYGQGSMLGNGRTNGMLLAQGDGYFSGLRVWTSYPSGDLRFELGRAKPDHAFGLTAPGPVPDGTWHHLAAVWDGHELRLYLNGIVMGAAAYSGEYTPSQGPLRIGYANAGVGSLKLDVDEVAVYRTALAPEEIFAHAYPDVRPSKEVTERLIAGTEALARGDWAAAEAQFAQIVRTEKVPAELRAAARLALGRARQSQGDHTAAVAQYTAVFDSKDAPRRLREIALRMCVPREPGDVAPAASKRVYQRLLELDELDARQRARVRRCLAECCLREGDPAGARAQFAELLRTAELDPHRAWDLRLQVAHTYLAAKDYRAARAQYAELAARTDAPPELRGIALLCIGHALTREKAYGAAAEAFAVARDDPGLLAYHRREAEERMREAQRAARGLSARDPAASRRQAPPLPEPGATLHVAPGGDDAGPGTRERPFASLEGARDAIRRLKAKDGLPPGGVAVFVRGGRYPVRRPFELTAADSGTLDSPIVYRALPGEMPRFRGGVVLSGARQVTDERTLAKLPPEARGKVLTIDLKSQGVTDYGSLGVRGYGRSGYPTLPWVDLYVDGRPQQLARWPNEGFVPLGKVTRGRFRTQDSGSPGEFEYQGDRPSRWTAAEDPWMFGYWGNLWAGRYAQIASIDAQKRRITTQRPATYGFREGQPYYCFNLIEELDRPGEWYLDRAAGTIYFYPPPDSDGAEVEFPILSAPFVVVKDASHVTLAGLVFELGRAEGAVISGGQSNLLAGCTFRRLGTNAVIIDGGSGHGVLGCDLHSLGAGGVRVRGGDRKTLTPAGHFVENCHIRGFSRVDRVYAPAVHVDGVGIRVAHNLMHDSPHHAMRVEGYEHKIEYNEIHSVVYEGDDQAGIDMFGNPAYRGNVIRYNFFHHIGSGHDRAGQAGVRLDDFISAVVIYGNVFYRCSAGQFGGVQIHGGKDNVVENNLFVDCKVALSFSPWGTARWLERIGSERTVAAIKRGGVDVTRPPHSTRYPDLARMRDNADRNFIRRNLIVDCGGMSARDRGVNEMMDNHVLGAEVGFADRAGRDFSLPEDSPVFDRFGFRPIPFDEIGLYEDRDRATWPVQHDVSPRYVAEE